MVFFLDERGLLAMLVFWVVDVCNCSMAPLTLWIVWSPWFTPVVMVVGLVWVALCIGGVVVLSRTSLATTRIGSFLGVCGLAPLALSSSCMLPVLTGCLIGDTAVNRMGLTRTVAGVRSLVVPVNVGETVG